MKIALRFLFWAGIVFTVMAPVFIGIVLQDKSTSWVAALCGAFITFVSRLDDIAELSLGPVRAKMRETIAAANATIDQLRAVGAATAKAILTENMAANFWDGTSLDTRLALHDQLIESLRQIGATDAMLSDVDEMWKRGIGVIYHRGIRHAIVGTAQNGVMPAQSPDQKRVQEEWNATLDFETWKVSRPDEMRAFFNRNNSHRNTTIDELIADYESFLDSGEIQRREVFVKL